jgi:acylphosphatase
MAQIKAELIVKGKVQKRGYRDHVQEVARELNVKGYVENMRDGSVRVVCETEEAALKKFIQAISLKTDFITVEKVEILRMQPTTGEYEFFEIKCGPLEEEMGERLVAAFTIAAATRQDIKNMHGEVKDMRGDLKGMHSDIKNMNSDLKNIHFELKDMHGELKDVHSNLKDMRGDMKDMHHDLKTSIESMHGDMNRHFEEMAKRYDAISAELLRTREELKRSVDTLVELVHKFLEKS